MNETKIECVRERERERERQRKIKKENVCEREIGKDRIEGREGKQMQDAIT